MANFLGASGGIEIKLTFEILSAIHIYSIEPMPLSVRFPFFPRWSTIHVRIFADGTHDT